MAPIARLRVLALAGAIAVAGVAATAAADPIVVRNGSYVEGDGWIWSQGSTVADDFYASWNDGVVFPTSGTGSASGSLTMSAAGATLTPSSQLTTTISGSRFSAQGGAQASFTTDSTFTDPSFVNLRASSTVVIEFMLTSWHTFSYTAQYTAAGEGFDSTFENVWSIYGLLYRVVPLGQDSSYAYNYFRDDVSSDRTTEHTGLLQPGHYFLQTRGGLLLRRPDTTGRVGFNVAFGLSPAPEPVPEPATLFLIGTGLAGVVIRRRRARL